MPHSQNEDAMAASDLEVDIGASMRTGPGNELTAQSTDSAILARAGRMKGHTDRRKARPKASGAVEVPEAAPRAAPTPPQAVASPHGSNAGAWR